MICHSPLGIAGESDTIIPYNNSESIIRRKRKGVVYLVKLAVKKVYCSKCQKLMRVKLQQTGGKSQFSCIKCDSVIWQKEGFNWKHGKTE
jgi:hypothetical protein